MDKKSLSKKGISIKTDFAIFQIIKNGTNKRAKNKSKKQLITKSKKKTALNYRRLLPILFALEIF